MKQLLGAMVGVLTLSACGPDPIMQWVVAGVNNHVVAGPSAECDLIPDKDAKTFNNKDVIFTIYQGSKDKYYLDPGTGNVLEGTKASGNYSFSAQKQTVTISPDLNHPSVQITNLHTEQYTITPDSSKVKGSYTVEDKTTCDNKDSTQACTFALPKVKDCISTGELQGSQLENPEYKQVASPPSGPGPSPDSH